MGFFDSGFSSAINGATSLFGMIGQNAQYKRNLRIMREQQAYQTKEREAAQAWNEKMWQMNNEYNDPSAAKQRLLNAGINPYMSNDIGVGQSNSPAASTSGQAAPSSASSPEFMSSLSPLQQAISQASQLIQQDKQIMSNIDLNASNSKLNFSNIDLNALRGGQLTSLANLQDTQKSRLNALLPYELENLSADTAAMKAKMRLDDANAQLAYTNSFGQVIKNNLSQKELETFDENFTQTQALKYAQAVQASAAAGMSDQMAKFYLEMTLGEKFMNDLNKKFKKEIEDAFVSDKKAEKARTTLEENKAKFENHITYGNNKHAKNTRNAMANYNYYKISKDMWHVRSAYNHWENNEMDRYGFNYFINNFIPGMGDKSKP